MSSNMCQEQQRIRGAGTTETLHPSFVHLNDAIDLLLSRPDFHSFGFLFHRV